MRYKQFQHPELAKRKKLNQGDLCRFSIEKRVWFETGWNTKEDERKKNELLNWDHFDFQKYSR